MYYDLICNIVNKFTMLTTPSVFATQSHLPQRGRQQGLYNFLIMYKLVNLYILRLASSDEGAVDCKLTVRQFTFYKSTEGGIKL